MSLRRLRHRVGTIEEEDRDLFVECRPDVHRTVYPGAGFVPVRQSGGNRDALGRPTIAVFDRQRLAANYDGDA